KRVNQYINPMTECLKQSNTPRDASSYRTAAFSWLKNFGCADQRDPHTPGQRNPNEGPEDSGFRIQSAEADTVGARRNAIFCASCLQFRDVLGAHGPLRIDRPDQIVANQSDHEHARQDIERVVIEMVAWPACRELSFADVVHNDWANDTGCRPSCKQPAMNCTHKLGAEHVGEISRYGCKSAAIHGQDDADRAD